MCSCLKAVSSIGCNDGKGINFNIKFTDHCFLRVQYMDPTRIVRGKEKLTNVCKIAELNPPIIIGGSH